MRRVLTLAVATIGMAACGTAPRPVEPAPPPTDTQPAAPPPNAAFLPSNTHLSVELNSTLNAATAQIGDVFTVTVLEPIIAQNNATVIPDSTVITGLVTGVDRSTEAGDQAAIRLNFVRMNLRGVSHPLSAFVVSTALSPEEPADDEESEPATSAPLGAVIRGELRIALIAESLGAGAGTIVSLGTGESGAVLPAGTQMTIRTRDRVDLRN